jgi:hypothetical protein
MGIVISSGVAYDDHRFTARLNQTIKGVITMIAEFTALVPYAVFALLLFIGAMIKSCL